MLKRRSWRWRFFRFVVLGFAGLVTLFVLFHAEENWRGKRAWEQYRKEQEAKGVSFEYSSVVPPPVPEDKNFAMTPLLKPLLELNPPDVHPRQKNTNGVQHAQELNLDPQPFSNEQAAVAELPKWRLGKRLDLALWQAAIFESTNFQHHAEKNGAAEDVLYALNRFAQELAELQEASRTRPYSRFDVHYDEENKAGILLPHLAVVRNICKVLQLRGAANLAAGKPDEAFADVNLMFRLTDSIDTEPVIISKLVRHACFQIAVETIWEGLLDHRWKPEHLSHWQQKLVAYDFIKDGYAGMQGERAFGNDIIYYLRKNPHMLALITDYSNGSGGLNLGFERHAYRLIPSGWFYQEQISYDRLYSEFILNVNAKDKTSFDAKNVKEARDRMEKAFAHRDPFKAVVEHKVLTYILMPSMSSFIQKCAYNQSTSDLALVALALEQYHLKHQDYPPSLESLTPDYAPTLPQDILANASFRYERQSKDNYLLRSVGWNLKDDNGTVALKGSSTINQDEGDWTWPQLVKASE